MYDAMVAEYEVVDRVEAINQQLDYAQATIQSLKEDRQYQHSTFLEWTIVLLIAFEVTVEMHALGWIAAPPWLLRWTGATATGGAAAAPEGEADDGAPSGRVRHHKLARSAGGAAET